MQVVFLIPVLRLQEGGKGNSRFVELGASLEKSPWPADTPDGLAVPTLWHIGYGHGADPSTTHSSGGGPLPLLRGFSLGELQG